MYFKCSNCNALIVIKQYCFIELVCNCGHKMLINNPDRRKDINKIVETVSKIESRLLQIAHDRDSTYQEIKVYQSMYPVSDNMHVGWTSREDYSRIILRLVVQSYF